MQPLVKKADIIEAYNQSGLSFSQFTSKWCIPIGTLKGWICGGKPDPITGILKSYSYKLNKNMKRRIMKKIPKNKNITTTITTTIPTSFTNTTALTTTTSQALTSITDSITTTPTGRAAGQTTYSFDKLAKTFRDFRYPSTIDEVFSAEMSALDYKCTAVFCVYALAGITNATTDITDTVTPAMTMNITTATTTTTTTTTLFNYVFNYGKTYFLIYYV